MKAKPMLKYCISLFLVLSALALSAQEPIQDTLVIKHKYGLRIGFDMYGPIQNAITPKRKSYEVVADYRLSYRLFIAAEMGNTDNLTKVDYMQFNTTGNYIKAGVDYNSYNNWLGMDNMIYFGARIGYSNFSQELLSYTINANPFFDEIPIDTPQKFDNLTAKWFEIVFGIKAETLNNLYLGFSFRSKFLISADEPTNFKNLYIPGFDRVFLNDTGFGFNYTLSYLIPFKKK
ncbi:MAG: hypothetical protein HQ471_08525 [Flavobacteriales bacterium]|jgi:hypothetical protein|nr:hypothetical protein [Flavobacteriales bacterium]